MKEKTDRFETFGVAAMLACAVGLLTLLVPPGCVTVDQIVASIPTNTVEAVEVVKTNLPPVTKTNEAPVVPASTGVLVDPPFSVEYMNAKGSWEEVGLEQSKKIIIRCCVWRPSVGDWWMLTTPMVKHVRRVGDKTVVDAVFTEDGYTYRLQGWLKSREPRKGEKAPPYDYTTAEVPWGTKWSIWYIEKEAVK